MAGFDAWAGPRAALVVEPLASDLEAALVESPPLNLADGGVFRDGYDPDLDAIRDAAHGGRRWMAELEAREREASGIANLKVGYNRVFGYYDRGDPFAALAGARPLHPQADPLDRASDIVTPELKERRRRSSARRKRSAGARTELFRAALREGHRGDRDAAVARDGARRVRSRLSFAESAAARGYARPVLDRSRALAIEEGRHPVVEKAVGVGSFVPNDLVLDGEERQVVILTGPNMAGKSTYLRQIGLIVLMAQAGSYVPARAARIGVVDRIFTRVGSPRRDRAGAVDVPGGDDRDEQHPAPRDGGEPRPDGRGRTGDLDLRRALDRLGGRRGVAGRSRGGGPGPSSRRTTTR